MNPLKDLKKLKDRYYGFYMGEVKQIENDSDDMKTRTGRAKIKIHPFFSKITDNNDLPWSYPAYPLGDKRHDTPAVDDVVLCFFIGGYVLSPVYAFGFPHLKSDLPTTPEVSWQQPNFYDTLDNNTVSETVMGESITEPAFSYTDNFPNKKSFKRGKILLEVDETEDSEHILLHILDTNYYFRIDTNRNIIHKFVNLFLHLDSNFYITLTDLIAKFSGKAYFDIDSNKIKINNEGVEVEDKFGNKIEMKTSGIIITDKYNNIITMNNLGIKYETPGGNNKINTVGQYTMLDGTEPFIKGTVFNTWISSILLTIFNAHTHSAPGGSTGPPSSPLTPPINYLSTVIKGT